MGQVTVRLGGVDYEGWHAVSVVRGLEQASASFSCSVSERTTGYALEPWVFGPGAPCTILLDGELVVTGYVDSYAPRFDATSHGVEIRGRSRTADFVDGAAIVPGGQFKSLSLGEIAQRLAAPFGLSVTSTAGMGVEGPRPSADFVGPMPPLHDVQVHQGETCHALLERLARVSGLLITDTADGNLALTRVGSRVAVTALVQGGNILGASAELDCSQRFSEYTVKGQRANTDDRIDRADSPSAATRDGTTQDGSGAGASVCAAIGAVADAFVSRYRPWLMTAETQVDDAMCQARAMWEARRRAGHSTHASVVVAGWRQIPYGPLWDVNVLVPVVSDWLGIDRVLLVSTVEFRKDAGGATTRLELTLPDAYAGDGDPVPGAQPASGTSAGGAAGLWQGGSIEAIVTSAGGIFS
jgi:prophage tail gpP-like protein